MTDTGGEGYPALKDALNTEYPEIEFEVFNYGVGGTRVGYGLYRLTHEYEFNEKTYAPLISLDPDIVLVESFAYNNGSDGPREGGIEHFRKMHYQIVEVLKQQTNAIIVYIVTIAPDTEHFLESVPSFINTPVEIRKWMAEDRMMYLEETLKIAEELNLPVVDVYNASLDAAKQGIPLSRWINPKDWIHPGEEGHKFITKNIAQTFVKKGLL